MVALAQFGSPSFQLAAKGLIALHRLMKDGKDDAHEAEAIRDALDVPLNALNPIEDKRAQWLSEDLYSIGEHAAQSSVGESNIKVHEELEDVCEAQQKGELDLALSLLREAKSKIAPSLLSSLRGLIWQEMGNDDVASEFFRHAWELEPSNSNYLAMCLDTTAKSDLNAARKLAKVVLNNDVAYAPVAVAFAADILFRDTLAEFNTNASQLRRDLVSILERNAVRLSEEITQASRRTASALTFGMLGFCHEYLGDMGKATQYYTLGLSADPDNDVLLVARGSILYGTNAQSILDLEQSVRLGSDAITPYLFLAHHYLITNHFEAGRDICERGLMMLGSNAAKSRLEEWRAIAHAQLGATPHLVRAAFNSAIRFDPTNDLAKRNLAIYETTLATLQAPANPMWEQQSPSVLRVFGMAERRHSLAA